MKGKQSQMTPVLCNALRSQLWSLGSQDKTVFGDTSISAFQEKEKEYATGQLLQQSYPCWLGRS